MKESDIVSVNCRLIPETYHMVGEKQIAMMKPTAILSTPPAPVWLTRAPSTRPSRPRRFGGAALDVFDVEPTSIDYRMIALDNCTVTSHMAGTTVHAMSRFSPAPCQPYGQPLRRRCAKTWMNRGKVELKKLEI